jgi:hypothetical protein
VINIKYLSFRRGKGEGEKGKSESNCDALTCTEHLGFARWNRSRWRSLSLRDAPRTQRSSRSLGGRPNSSLFPLPFNLFPSCLSVVASACLIFTSSSAIADDVTIVPTIPYEQGNGQVKRQTKVPDWSKITWAMLPALQEAGFLKVPKEFVPKLGYDPSRSWNAGQKSDSVVMLGDADDAFKFGDFNLNDIAYIGSPANVKDKDPTLKDVGFMQWQTTASLVKAIPSLGNLRVTQVKPILAVLGQSGYLPNSCRNGTISECLQSNPKAAKRPLGDIDLSKYSTKSIPGLERTQIRRFQDWQRTYINQIPGLNQVPFAQMPNPINSGTSVVGIASVVFGKSERGDSRVGADYFISGSVVRGDYTVTRACETGKECAYLELGDFAGQNGQLYGKR